MRKHKEIAKIAALGAAMAATLAVGTSSPATAGSTRDTEAAAHLRTRSADAVFKNVGSRLCIGVRGSATHSGADAVQGKCRPRDPSQRWVIRDVQRFSGLKWAQLKNKKSGLCLGVTRSSTDSGAKLVQGNCQGTDDHTQYWHWTRRHAVFNGKSRLCVGIRGSSLKGGAKVIQGTCSGTPTQTWFVLI